MITIGAHVCDVAAAAGPEADVFSVRAIDAHFWMHTIGVVFYIASMWIAGVMQGLMWRATNDDGTLTYTFVEALNATYPYYLVRLSGGLLVLGGMLLMAWNVWQTAQPAALALQPMLPPMYRKPRMRNDHSQTNSARESRKERRPDGVPDRGGGVASVGWPRSCR